MRIIAKYLTKAEAKSLSRGCLNAIVSLMDGKKLNENQKSWCLVKASK